MGDLLAFRGAVVSKYTRDKLQRKVCLFRALKAAENMGFVLQFRRAQFNKTLLCNCGHIVSAKSKINSEVLESSLVIAAAAGISMWNKKFDGRVCWIVFNYKMILIFVDEVNGVISNCL